MNFHIVKTIFFKELKDTLRDSKTLIIMILLPILLYPLLAVGGGQLLIQQGKKIEAKVVNVSVNAKNNTLYEHLARREKMQLVDLSEPKKALKEGKIDAYLEIPSGFSEIVEAEKTSEVTIYYDQANIDSLSAVARLQDSLDEYREKVIEERITSRAIKPEILKPLEAKTVNVAPKEKIGGFYLGNILPLLIIFMTILGAFYPAIDQTAGEKERGTLETLLTTPVKKYEIITGKFLTISLFAFVTGLLNLGSMVLSMNLLLGSDKMNFHVPWLSVFLIFLILIPTTMFFVALMILVASLANSFKDAQNYLTPVYIVCGFPAMVTIIPGINLTFQSALIPVANVSLLIKELLLGNYAPDLIMLVLGSTTIYSVIAIAAATKLFNREEVLLSEESNLRMLFFDKHAKLKKTPNYIEAITLYIIAFGLLFYVGSPLQSQYKLTGLLITEVLLIMVPALLFVKYLKFNFIETFNLRKISLVSLLGSALLALSGSFFVLKFVQHVQDRFMPMPEEFKEAFYTFITDESGQPVGLLKLILIISVSAAVCEEFLFRGPILSGIRDKFSRIPTIIIVGLLFGLFHMSIYRLIPTSTLGFLITYIVLATGSIFNGIFFHLINNGTAVLFEFTEEKYWMDPNVEYWYYYPIFAVLFAAGLYLIRLEEKKNGTKKEVSEK